MKRILDACCGSRMCWFDKDNTEALFMDIRQETTTLCDGRTLTVCPDVVGDFRNMPFDNESVNLVLFDPLGWLRSMDGYSQHGKMILNKALMSVCGF